MGWPMPAIDPAGVGLWSVLYQLMSVVKSFSPDRFSFILLPLPMFVHAAIQHGLFPLGVCVLLLCLLGRLIHTWIEFETFFILSTFLLYLVVVAGNKIDPDAAVDFIVISIIVFSSWFLSIHPIGKLEMVIGMSIFVLLALNECLTDSNCAVGSYCDFCGPRFLGWRCIQSPISNPFKLINNSSPFNKYAFLTTHNAYAIKGKLPHTGVTRGTTMNQEENVTQQLNNGVRALMLDTYDFEGDIWLCNSLGGKCSYFTAFGLAIDTMREIEAFLSQNPSEIVTLILEDYVQAPNGLTKLFNDSGLSRYWFPLSNMPLNGQDWPLVSDMVANNQRLIVFTSIKSKQDTEGIAYQWNYIVENQHGDGGMHPGICSNRKESSPLRDKSKALVLVNYFRTIPNWEESCEHNSKGLINMLCTCYAAAGDRWANFVAVDYYKRSEGGASFQAVNPLNRKLLCGCDDVHACVPGSTAGACTP